MASVPGRTRRHLEPKKVSCMGPVASASNEDTSADRGVDHRYVLLWKAQARYGSSHQKTNEADGNTRYRQTIEQMLQRKAYA